MQKKIFINVSGGVVQSIEGIEGLSDDILVVVRDYDTEICDPDGTDVAKDDNGNPYYPIIFTKSGLDYTNE